MIILIFAHFNLNFKCVFEADLFDHVQENVLSQYDKNNIFWSIAYFSWKLNVIKSNYEIYDKELLAIIQCFEQWCFEFEDFTFLIQVLTDHKNLQYFMITKQLTHWQTQWTEYLSCFNFKITY